MPHKLLLADDSVTIQRVVELTFADENIDVVTVSDGASAIEAITRETPDIVLADASMPKKDGYEVASFVKGDPARAHVPVLLLTGAFEPVDESRADTIGCDGVLVKPFEPQQVIGKVKELLGITTQDEDAGVAAPPAGVSWETVEAPPAEPTTASAAGLVDTGSIIRPSTVVPPAGGAPDSGPPAPEVPVFAAVSSVPATPTVGHTTGSVLAQAFATFLAVEQGAPPPALRVATSAQEPSSAPPELTDAMFESLVDRVVERMTDSIVRETTVDLVSQVAERLVRAEIDRIKAGAE